MWSLTLTLFWAKEDDDDDGEDEEDEAAEEGKNKQIYKMTRNGDCSLFVLPWKNQIKSKTRVKKNPKQPNIATQIKDQRKQTFKGFFLKKPSEPCTYCVDQRSMQTFEKKPLIRFEKKENLIAMFCMPLHK